MAGINFHNFFAKDKVSINNSYILDNNPIGIKIFKLKKKRTFQLRKEYDFKL
jgi:hypothetical protein